MSDPGETAGLVALLRTGRRPWVQYADLVEEAGDALSVLERELSAPEGQGSLLAPDPDGLLDAAAHDIAQWQARGIRLMSVLDRGYPENLRGVHDRPPLIFVAGRLQAADTRSIAVVGARKASHAGAQLARTIASALVAEGYTVVSGLAAGIDTAAHTAALESNGRTVAVIGTGLSRSYPRRTQRCSDGSRRSAR